MPGLPELPIDAGEDAVQGSESHEDKPIYQTGKGRGRNLIPSNPRTGWLYTEDGTNQEGHTP